MLDHFRMFAAYNDWANRRIYEAAAGLTEAEWQQPTGAFFGSMMGTLNHLLVADRVWMARLTGKGPQPKALDEILYADFDGLRKARQVEDARIMGWLEDMDEESLSGHFSYRPLTTSLTTSSDPITQRILPALAHMFNHQTHHRGQAHTILTTLGKPSLVLDLIYFQRLEGKRWA